MTALSRKLKRSVPGGRRGLVVILHPGAEPLLEIRERRRRRGYAIPIRNLFVILGQREADRLRAEKRAARKARRLERGL